MENEKAGPIGYGVESLASSLEKVLNSHGYSFQYAVIERAKELAEQQKAFVRFEVSELPVGGEGDATHIDFILLPRTMYQGSDLNIFIVSECKRVNPAKSKWCFVKSPYRMPSDSRIGNTAHFDTVNLLTDDKEYTASTLVSYVDEGRSFDLGFEIKSGAKSDPLSPLS